MTRTFRPVFLSENFAPYVLTHYTADVDGGNVRAYFADGHVVSSIFPTVDALLQAGRADWRERVYEVTK